MLQNRGDKQLYPQLVVFHRINHRRGPRRILQPRPIAAVAADFVGSEILDRVRAQWLVVSFCTRLRILAPQNRIPKRSLVVLEVLGLTGQAIQATGDFHQVVRYACFLGHPQGRIGDPTHAGHPLMHAGSTGRIRLGTSTAHILPEVFGGLTMKL